MDYCLKCDCYDADLGCTMPSCDKVYACPYEIFYCIDCTKFNQCENTQGSECEACGELEIEL